MSLGYPTPEVYQLWASTSYRGTSQTTAGQRQKAKHQQRWKEQRTETQKLYVSPRINNGATESGRWLSWESACCTSMRTRVQSPAPR